MTAGRSWGCPHLTPEEWELVQRALRFAAKHANREPQTGLNLEALHGVIETVRARNLERRAAKREATRRYRARRREQDQSRQQAIAS